MNGSIALRIADAANDQTAFVTALDCAHRRAQHSCFNQHIIADAERGYIAIDEGDYGALSQQMMDRVIQTIPGALLDEY